MLKKQVVGGVVSVPTTAEVAGPTDSALTTPKLDPVVMERTGAEPVHSEVDKLRSENERLRCEIDHLRTTRIGEQMGGESSLPALTTCVHRVIATVLQHAAMVPVARAHVDHGTLSSNRARKSDDAALQFARELFTSRDKVVMLLQT